MNGNALALRKLKYLLNNKMVTPRIQENNFRENDLSKAYKNANAEINFVTKVPLENKFYAANRI